jgi:hypothetical protein
MARRIQSDNGPKATIALLRIKERADKEREYQNFVGDLRQVAALLRRQAA